MSIAICLGQKSRLALWQTLQRRQSLPPIALLNADVDVTLPPGLISSKGVGSVGEGILGQVRTRQ